MDLWGVVHPQQARGTLPHGTLQVLGWHSVQRGCPSIRNARCKPIPVLGTQEKMNLRMLRDVQGMLGAMGLLGSREPLSLLLLDA